MRQNADAHFATWIYRETLETASTARHSSAITGRRPRDFTLQVLPVFGGKFRPMQIKRDHFFWR
jgi:hypothetical protein